MKFKNLDNFKHIFDRNDFDIISDNHTLIKIHKIIRYHIKEDSKDLRFYKDILGYFFKNFQSFYFNLECENIHHLKNDYENLQKLIIHLVSILDNDYSSRKDISGHYLRKWDKSFNHIINNFYKHLFELFDEDNICKIKIPKDSIKNFLLDENIGLGKCNVFKRTTSKFNIITHLKDLDKKEISHFIKSVKSQDFHEFVKPWTVWGDNSGHHTIRIHLIKKKKPILYRVYKVHGEHNEHERDLKKEVA